MAKTLGTRKRMLIDLRVNGDRKNDPLIKKEHKKLQSFRL